MTKQEKKDAKRKKINELMRQAEEAPARILSEIAENVRGSAPARNAPRLESAEHVGA